jgi:hypothetical protein
MEQAPRRERHRVEVGEELEDHRPGVVRRVGADLLAHLGDQLGPPVRVAWIVEAVPDRGDQLLRIRGHDGVDRRAQVSPRLRLLDPFRSALWVPGNAGLEARRIRFPLASHIVPPDTAIVSRPPGSFDRSRKTHVFDIPETGRAASCADGHFRSGPARGIRQGGEGGADHRSVLAAPDFEAQRN